MSSDLPNGVNKDCLPLSTPLSHDCQFVPPGSFWYEHQDLLDRLNGDGVDLDPDAEQIESD